MGDSPSPLCPRHATLATPLWSFAAASGTLFSFLGTLKVKRQCGLDTQETIRQELPEGLGRVFAAELSARERGQGQPRRGHWARGCNGTENTDRNKEKGVRYGS